MLAGCRKVNITPKIGTPIGGNVRDDNTSKGVHDPLFANLLYLQNKGTETLFIGLDVIGVHQSFVENIKQAIQSTCGISTAYISVFATHTHSGPDLMEAFKNEYHPLVQEYMTLLHQKVTEAATLCMQDTWEAKLRIAQGHEDSLSFNRRLVMRDGTIRMNWEDLDPQQVLKTTGPIDPDLFVITVVDQHNRPRSMIVNFTLHPAVLVGKDGLFSRDYIHFLTKYLQATINRDLVVLFANGAEGNINHMNIHDPEQSRDFEEAERIGCQLAEQVVNRYDSFESMQNPDLDMKTEMIRLPGREISLFEVDEAKQFIAKTKGKIPSLLDGVPDEIYACEIIYLYEEGQTSISTSLQVAAIQDTALVFLPGEFFVEFGLEIKARSPFNHTFVVGMANDYIGYVPTEIAFEEGGYEVRTARTSRLAPEAGQMVVHQVVQMLAQLKGGDSSEG